MDKLAKYNKPEEIKSESGALIRLAIENKLDVAQFEKLLQMRRDEERYQAEKEFDFHFAEMQRDYVPARKTKDVKTLSGDVAYSYCPLPDILSVYAPILARHGFSYRWEETEKDGKEKTTTCYLSGHGFTRTASITLPYGEQNKLINPIQARGATSEYGRRYTFMNVTGCIVADSTDTDGRIETPSLSDVRKNIDSLLRFIPESFRSVFKNIPDDKVSLFYDKLIVLKERCQKIQKNAKNKDPKTHKEIMAALRDATSDLDLAECENKLDGGKDDNSQ